MEGISSMYIQGMYMHVGKATASVNVMYQST